MLVEMLERRGMLSVSIGSLADDAGDDAGAPADAAAETSTGSVGLPSGFSLLVASPVAWQEFGTGQIAPTPAWDGVDEPEISGPCFRGAIEVAGPLGGIGFSGSAFGVLTRTDLTLGAIEDSVDPPDFELAPEDTPGGGEDPVIIVDPVFIAPPTVDLDESMEPPAPPDTEAPPLDAEGNDEDPLVVVDPVFVDPPTVDPDWKTVFGDLVMISEPVAADGERSYAYDRPVALEDPSLPVCVMPAPVPSAESSNGLDSPSTVTKLASDEKPSQQAASAGVTDDSSAPRATDPATASRNGGDFAAAAAWLNITSGGEPDTARLPGGKRRTR